MKTSEEWAALDQFLIDPKRPAGTPAPRAVHASVSSLVDPADIKAAVVRYAAGPPTVWTAYVVTDGSLAFVEVEFEDVEYTGDEERDRRREQRKPSEFNVTQAWVRPLDTIVELSVDAVSVLLDSGWFGVNAKVMFRGEPEPVELPNQVGMSGDDQRARSDELLRCIRNAISRREPR